MGRMMGSLYSTGSLLMNFGVFILFSLLISSSIKMSYLPYRSLTYLDKYSAKLAIFSIVICLYSSYCGYLLPHTKQNDKSNETNGSLLKNLI